MRRRGRPRYPDILTPREWEVLSLIEQGASNEEISQRLGITERTAKYHVSEILSKLGVSSREEAVAAVGERTVRTAVARWALWLRIAAVLSAAGVLMIVLVLAWDMLQGGGDDGVSAEISVTDVYSRALASAARSGSLLHISFEQVSSDGGAEKQLREGEMWVDAAGDSVRRESHNGRDATNQDSVGDELTIAAKGFLYTHFDSPALGSRANRSEFKSLCGGTESTVIAAIFSCGVDPVRNTGTPADIASQVDTHAQFEGHPAIVVLIGYANTTATPNLIASVFTTYFYFDPATFLPLGESVGLPFDTTTRLQTEFIDKSSVASDYLDPKSIGYGLRDPDANRAEIASRVNPYWLGDQFVVNGSSEYILMGADLTHALGGTASLEYEAPDGYPAVDIYLWDRNAWVTFLAQATSKLLSRQECTTETDVTGGGYTARTYNMPVSSPADDPCRVAARGSGVPLAKYFVFVDVGDVVVDIRPAGGSELDNLPGIRSLLERLRPWAGQ